MSSASLHGGSMWRFSTVSTAVHIFHHAASGTIDTNAQFVQQSRSWIPCVEFRVGYMYPVSFEPIVSLRQVMHDFDVCGISAPRLSVRLIGT